MATNPDPVLPRAPARSVEAEPDVPWVRESIGAGLLGAATVALLFFVVDLANGRPLWTPHALGSALFEGRIAPPDAEISAALIGAYTVIHGWVFVSIALVAGALLNGSDLSPERRPARIVALAVGLFAAFSAAFLAFGLLRGPDAARPFSIGWLLLVNAAAALVMAGWMGTRLTRPSA
jgi:hypothetical protein